MIATIQYIRLKYLVTCKRFELVKEIYLILIAIAIASGLSAVCQTALA
jgi:hypothetical protein